MSPDSESPPGQAANIFISYRRDDTAGHAGRLFDRLNEVFPGRVFMDINAIEPGLEFAEALDRALASCRVVIVLIGRSWLSVTDAVGARRLDNPKDFVRREVATVLKRKVRVIPVLVQGAGVPSAELLPEDLEELAQRQAIELSDTRWGYDVGRLVATLRGILGRRFNVRLWIGIAAVLALVLAAWMVWRTFKPPRTETTKEETPAAQTVEAAQTVAESEETPGLTMDEMPLPPAHSTLWVRGTTLRVHFLDGNADQKEKFRKALAAWLQYANLRSSYVEEPHADVRASFAKSGSWAYMGRDALALKGPSINLGFQGPGLDGIPNNYLHDIGHVLGLIHEFKNPRAKLRWDRDAIYKKFSEAPSFQTKAQIDQSFFSPEPYPGSRPFDPHSIMMEYLPGELFKDGKGFAMPMALSESDKRYIATLYPRG